MKKWLQQGLLAFACAAMLASSLPAVQAAEEDGLEASAIDAQAAMKDFTGAADCALLFDGNEQKSLHLRNPSSFTFSHNLGIGSAYVIFDQPFGNYTMVNNETGQSHSCGENGFLHEFIDIQAIFGTAPKSISFYFEGELMINEIYLFTPGQVPGHVEKWEAPAESKVDVMLFSTHCDDEQLFFAGLLPYYAAERQYEVMVTYLTVHPNTESFRVHEMLNGLWAVGINNYPVFRDFGDYYPKNAQGGYELHAYMGEPKEKLQAYVVEQLRRYKPQLAVGHDILNGEYGHGQHMMYADLLVNSLALAEDENQFPESAQKWGTWSVPKTYLHLWPENPVVMDWDQPMEHFDGMTPYEVSKHRGFPAHRSQISGFEWFMNGKDKASDIQEHSPCEFGLYRTTVGPDTQKNDLFENLTSYAQQEAEVAAAAAEAAAAETQPPAETEAPAQPPVLPPEEPASVPYSPYLILTAITLVLTGLAALAAFLKRRNAKNQD